MFTVQVITTKSGKPATRKRVAVAFDGLRGVTKDQYTDSNGEVHFNHEPGRGKIFVDGRVEHQGQLSGRIVLYT